MTDLPVPTGREEAWRFTPVGRLRDLLDNPTFTGKLETSYDAPAGAEITSELPAWSGGPDYAAVERPAALVAEDDTATTLTVTVTGELDTPVVVRLQPDGASDGRIAIEAQPFSRGTVVLDHIGTAEFVETVDIRVGDGAQLWLVSLQDWDDGAVHLGWHTTCIGRDASFRAAHVTLGGDVVRINQRVRYSGSGGDVELLGLFFAGDGQHLEHRLLIDHAVPRCRSRVTYKGALQGEEAHTVWVGDVLIRPEAEQTDTYEINRNLLLTDGARADSIPNLEILTGEVIQAGHASATGRFDDEQLFYLQARGIPADEARRLVVRGFFAEVINAIEVPEIRDRLSYAIEHELSGARQ